MKKNKAGDVELSSLVPGTPPRSLLTDGKGLAQYMPSATRNATDATLVNVGSAVFRCVSG